MFLLILYLKLFVNMALSAKLDYRCLLRGGLCISKEIEGWTGWGVAYGVAMGWRAFFKGWPWGGLRDRVCVGIRMYFWVGWPMGWPNFQ